MEGLCGRRRWMKMHSFHTHYESSSFETRSGRCKVARKGDLSSCNLSSFSHPPSLGSLFHA
jgi:hypothetical protein